MVIGAGPTTHIYVADAGSGTNIFGGYSGNAQIEEYDATGTLLSTWSIPHGNYEFLAFDPSAICYIPSVPAVVVVGDAGNSEVDTFQ